jgi:hypothetical protein
MRWRIIRRVGSWRLKDGWDGWSEEIGESWKRPDLLLVEKIHYFHQGKSEF